MIYTDKKKGIYQLPSIEDYTNTEEATGKYQQLADAKSSLPRSSSSATLKSFGIEEKLANKQTQLSRVALSNMLYEYNSGRSLSATTLSDSVKVGTACPRLEK